jgi:hypothetical protein
LLSIIVVSRRLAFGWPSALKDIRSKAPILMIYKNKNKNKSKALDVMIFYKAKSRSKAPLSMIFIIKQKQKQKQKQEQSSYFNEFYKKIIKKRERCQMMNITTNGRTAWVGALTEKNGRQEILFRIAVRKFDGTAEFYLCKLTGNNAVNFAKLCSDKKEDGKIVSRYVMLSGFLNTFTAKKKVTVSDEAGNEFEVEVPTQDIIINATSFELLDSKPTNNNSSSKPVAKAVAK